jgi:signal transduction histidine kinase
MARGEGRIDVESVSRNQMEPVVAVDTDGTVAFANERFYAISGLARETVVGSDFAVFGRIVETGFEALEKAVKSVLSGDSTAERVELSMRHPEEAPVPRRLPAEARVTPIRIEDGFDDEGDDEVGEESDDETVDDVDGVIVSLRKIGTRKAYERQLERQNERLEEFAGVVAHDLRNPLNVAEGHLELAGEECQSTHLAAAETALGRMWRIIDDTLTLAKQGQYVGTNEDVSLSALLEQCWATVDTGDATLTLETELTIEADPDRLRNLFENLFRNAVEHGSATDGGVRLRVGAIDGIESGFYVADDGPGIPPEGRERVFDLGYSTAESGTGYGLSIVRWIAEAHGWDVAVTDGEDGGARFEFTGVTVVE